MSIFVILALTAVFFEPAPRAQAASLTVNVLTDAPDLGDTNGDGSFDAGETDGGGSAGCDTDAGTSGNQCSLRAAIYEANRNGDTADTITFGSLSGTINIGAPLPVGDSDASVAGADGLAASTTIDGNGNVTLSGGSSFACFTVTSASNTIRDLSITDCTDGVRIYGDLADGNAVRGNTIFGNTSAGVLVVDGDGNTIGGTWDRNVIRDNTGAGISLAGADGSIVQGNCIGTLANCSVAAPNGADGILISGGATNTTVGGTVVGAGNVIAFSGGDGVDLTGAGTGNVITRNVMFLNTGLGIRSPVASPVLTGCADAGGGNVSCTGTSAGAGLTVDVYHANVDASGPEGDRFLCTAVSGGGGAWGCTFGNPGGGSATATQRDPGGANNTSEFSAAAGIPPPALASDLIEASLTNPPASKNRGTSFSVTDTARNQGGAAATASRTRYYLSADKVRDSGDRLLTGARSVPALAPGATSAGTKSVTIPIGTVLGTYYLLACADDTGLVAESDETNNCLASVGTIQVTAPDLVETAVSNPPTSAARGGSFNVTDTTANVGTGPAGASTTRYYLSLDKTKSATDVLLTGSRAALALAAGANSSGTVSVTVTATTPLGIYYLLACADDLKVVKESKEGNNCRASGGTVQIVP